MKSLFAFTKKEITEQIRTGRLMFLGILFFALGIMNPAVAKLTPWLFEIFADSLTESGITVTEVTVSAIDCWVQFFKNIPIGLIVFVLLEASVFTKEYTSGTLVLSLTKGLERFKVIISKAAILSSIWTVGYWICFAVTYAYSVYFWDNSVVKNLVFSVACWWIFGVFVISLITLFSTLSSSSTGVLIGTGGTVLVSYLLGMLPKINRYLPSLLADGNSLIYGVLEPKAYVPAVLITAVATLICFAVSIPIFNKKQL